jgi:Family of unknown function (DUF6445)
MASERLMVFNPRPRIERVDLIPGQACLVIDDALIEPERLVEFATARSAEFRGVDSNAYYPGILLPMPGAVNAALNDFFIEHIRHRFHARRVLQMHCRLALTTLLPTALHPYQWICHSDNIDLKPAHSMQACVLYLFKDSSLGGTGFYAPLRPWSELRSLYRDAGVLPGSEFAARYGIEPGYQCTSNAFFQRVGGVEAQWNRMIFYDGGMLHSADISAPEKLSADARRGRLTLNGFFTSRRPVA